MNVWFVSDIHLGHPNCSAYCGRPWLRPGDYDFETKKWASDEARQACNDRSNAGLITNWNSRVKPGDTVYHLGDFCCKGNERGVPGSMTKAESWEAVLNGKIIHIRGNHDKNNGVSCALEHAVIKFAGVRWLLIHHPPYSATELPCDCDAVLCGHVHNAWHTKYMSDGRPMINVGVDVNKYAPVSKTELDAIYRKMERGQ